QEEVTETQQTMTVMGATVQQKQRQTMLTSCTPFKQEKGEWVLRYKLEQVKMEMEIGENKIAFDSSQPEDKSPFGDFFKVVVGSDFTFALDGDGKVTRVEGVKELRDRLAASTPMTAPALEQVLTDGAIKQMLQKNFDVLPTKRAGPGETWVRTGTTDLGSAGS